MNVQEELVSEPNHVDRAHVERRIEDWKRRIHDLYVDIQAWLPRGWTGVLEGQVSFDEELMRKFEVRSQTLPVLLLQADEERARVEPRGLWIIGANGRVDLIRPSQHFLIVDRAENFAPPNWQVSSLGNRMYQRPLSASLVSEMLA